MSMEKYAAKIDLSAFFDDERKLVLILIDNNWKNVECLQRKVEHIFHIDKVKFATNDGYFLPPEEDIEVLKFANVIKAFIPVGSIAKQRKKSKKSAIDKSLEATDSAKLQEQSQLKDDEYNDNKKRKFLSVIDDKSSTPNHAKRTKSLNNAHIPLQETTSETNGISSAEKLKQVEKKRNTLQLEASDEDGLNHKQLSHKKRKKDKCFEADYNKTIERTDSNVILEKPSNPFTRPPHITSSTPLSEGSKKLQKRKKNDVRIMKEASSNAEHVYYNESGDMASATTQKSDSEMQYSEIDGDLEKEVTSKVTILMRCSLEKYNLEAPRVFDIKRRKPTIEILEQLIVTQQLPTNESSTPARVDNIKTTNVLQMKGNISSDQTTVESFVTENVSSEEKELQNVSTAEESIAKVLTAEESTVNIATMEENNESCITMEKSNITIEADEKISVKNCVESLDEESNVLEETDVIDLDEESNIIDLSDAETEDSNKSHKDTKLRRRSVKRNEQLKIDYMLPLSNELEDTPLINDIILFKAFCSSGSDELTNYVAGKCEYINKRTKNIKLSIVDGKSEVIRLPHKFIVHIDDSSSDILYINIKLNDMIKPKVFRLP